MQCPLTPRKLRILSDSPVSARFNFCYHFATFLIDRDYTNRDKLFAHGLSSGSLLMGGIANMQAGHIGPTGRQASWKEIAFMYAFLLDLVDISK